MSETSTRRDPLTKSDAMRKLKHLKELIHCLSSSDHSWALCHVSMSVTAFNDIL